MPWPAPQEGSQRSSITSWPGPGTTQDANLAKLLAHAAYERTTGTHFVTSIYFESDADSIRSNLTGAMQYAVRRYTTGTIASIDRGFRSRIDAYNAAHGTHKIWAAGVEPGYDDTRVPGRAHPHRVPRNRGLTYRTSWLAAMNSRPDWITITSYNEWFEGSMIEPDVRDGTLYLALTRRYSGQWRRER